MTRKNKGNIVQMLSPENYIRQRSRSLPIYECLVNEDWKACSMANIIVARRHTNGNVTACLYNVDLLCLGVKDTHFMFNVSMQEYRENINMLKENAPMTEIDYTLAHNIIYAGLEFAADYGFNPHRDFTSVTRFILEEDTDDIDLIEIECGYQGKPAYALGPHDDVQKVKSILSQLERTAGPGNYFYLDEEN